MSFTEQQRNWEALAETDPLWAVLSEPEKRGNKWEVGEFYRSGLAEAEGVIETLAELGLGVNPTGEFATGEFDSILDVGCGPGRVTHGFALYETEVVGYDISDRMLDLARRAARPNEEYILNETDDLSFFEDSSFDFVYCSKVLQHVDGDKVQDYMAEMVRVLDRGGVLWLQMLSHPTGWAGTKESAPDPKWRSPNGDEPPHYSVCALPITGMIQNLLEMELIVHQVRLVEKGEGQSLFSYEYVAQRRS